MRQSAPIWVTATSTVPRHTRCEHCETEYVYELTRSRIGQAEWGKGDDPAVVEARASQAACRSLQAALDTGAEAVPCPGCLKYQEHMARAARELQWGWLRRAGSWALAAVPVATVLAVVVGVAASGPKTDYAVPAGAATAGVLLAATGIGAMLYYFAPCHPNTWSEAYRSEQAGALACTRTEFAVAARDGSLFTEELTLGLEEEYAGTLFLWVLPDEIASGSRVPFVTADEQPVLVELTPEDDDGAFLDADRVVGQTTGECRICLRVFNTYRPKRGEHETDLT